MVPHRLRVDEVVHPGVLRVLRIFFNRDPCGEHAPEPEEQLRVICARRSKKDLHVPIGRVP